MSLSLHGFPDLNDWQRQLASREPKALAATLQNLAQALPYLDPPDRARLTAAITDHPAQELAALAELWVEGVFMAAGPDLAPVLAAHAASHHGTKQSRALAKARSDELTTEREACATVRKTTARAADKSALLRLALPQGDQTRAAITLSPEALCRALQHLDIGGQRDALLAAGVAPVVATDCDGTVWKLDIGEALFDYACKERLFLPEAHDALATLLSSYDLVPGPDVNANAARLRQAFVSGELARRARDRGQSDTDLRVAYWSANVWCFAGHSVASIKAMTRTLFLQHGLAGKIFRGLADILDTARAAGLVPYAVSASGQWLVEVGAALLGIPPWRVLGLKTALRQGRLTTTVVQPIPYGPGKVELVRAATGGTPAVAMGDAVDATDRELLESALVRLAVEPNRHRQPLVEARGHDNWRFVDYQTTLDGEPADTFVL
jgi:phosphoserine phosphatase